jgi:hypothetical protein
MGVGDASVRCGSRRLRWKDVREARREAGREDVREARREAGRGDVIEVRREAGRGDVIEVRRDAGREAGPEARREALVGKARGERRVNERRGVTREFGREVRGSTNPGSLDPRTELG